MKSAKYLIIAVLFLALSGCKKEEKAKERLIGSWTRVWVEVQKYDVEWTFNSDGSVFRSSTSLSSSETTGDTGIYSIESKFLDYYYVIISEFERKDERGLDFNGKYRIDLLKKDLLAINRIEKVDGSEDAAYLRKEFVKSE